MFSNLRGTGFKGAVGALAWIVGAGACAVGASSVAQAAEGPTPLVPGVTTGVPVGALPPPGWYFSYTFYPIVGDVVDGQGHTLPVRVANYTNGFMFVWSSPYHFLGAQYGAMIDIVAASHGTDVRVPGGEATRRFGLFNTIVEPVILSWKVAPSLFVSTALTMYLDDGDYRTVNGARSQDSYANNFTTYEPSFAVSYLANGWNLTANLAYDFNTRNGATGYRTGHIGYLDLTAAKTIGNLTLGVLGNVTRQLQDDTLNGAVVGDGNRAKHDMLGVMLSYRFGSVTLTGRYLADVYTRSDVDLHTTYLTVSVPL